MADDVDWNRSNRGNLSWVFPLLVLFRWLSLIPPLVSIIISVSNGKGHWTQWLALLIAVSLNSIITLLSTRLNRALRSHSWLLMLDLISVAGLVALAVNGPTTYHLHAFSPLILSALFFQLQGAILATVVFIPLYLGALLINVNYHDFSPDWLMVVGDIVGFFLISGAFGLAAMMLARWRATNDELVATNKDLASAHHDLEVLHGLTASLHSAADVEAVQDQVLQALTTQLGFKRAVIGLVDDEAQVVTGWLGRVREGAVTELKKPLHQAKLPLAPESGEAVQALLAGQVCRATQEACTTSAWINEQFGMRGCLIVPIRWGMQPVGILLVDGSYNAEDSHHLRSLEAIAQETAVAVGMMTTRLRQARAKAIDEERARLAMDIHDTVSQSLFGIVFTLDGLLKLLPAEPEKLKPELEHVLQTAEVARQEIRHTIHDLWLEEMTASAFRDNLRQYVTDVLQAHNLEIRFDIRGDFSALTPKARRSLYRISQESLTNIVQHAAAVEARVCMDVADDWASLVVSDNGRGFEPEVAMAQEYGQGHFGLRGILERARSLGGTCDIFSQPDAGSSIVVDIPANL